MGGCNMPMTILSRGGRYCSMMTVERGKAFVLERRMARTATAAVRAFVQSVRKHESSLRTVYARFFTGSALSTLPKSLNRR